MSYAIDLSIVSTLGQEFRRVHPDFLYSHGGTPFDVDSGVRGLDKAFLGIVGSQSHNTYVPKDDPDSIDDIDIMGVVPLPASHLFGLRTFDHWTLKEGELDAVVYSLPKFFSMLLKGNPNVIGLLWLREQEHLQVPEWWERVVLNRHVFASKKNVYDAFAGYAKGQMEKMTSYTPAIDAEMQDLEKTLRAYGIAPTEAVSEKNLGASEGSVLGKSLKRYRKLCKKYHMGYMGEKRKSLVRKHGYDSKNAAHMIRLLRMGAEYLQSGEMHVFRTHDAEQLREIKRGEWSLTEVQHLASNLFTQCDYAYQYSTLPEYPDFYTANELLSEIAQENC